MQKGKLNFIWLKHQSWLYWLMDYREAESRRWKMSSSIAVFFLLFFFCISMTSLPWYHQAYIFSDTSSQHSSYHIPGSVEQDKDPRTHGKARRNLCWSWQLFKYLIKCQVLNFLLTQVTNFAISPFTYGIVNEGRNLLHRRMQVTGE